MHLSQCIDLDEQINPAKNWKDVAPQAFALPEIFLGAFPDLPAECLAKYG